MRPVFAVLSALSAPGAASARVAAAIAAAASRRVNMMAYPFSGRAAARIARFTSASNIGAL